MQGKVQPETRSADPVYVGVDVCKSHLDLHFHPLGRSFRISNDHNGIQRLKRLLAREQVALVVMEATASYHRMAHRSLSQAGFAVAVVNPLRSHLFAEVLGKHAKTDRIDARMLAILGATLTPEAKPPVPRVVEALQELLHARSAAVAERTALSNRLGVSQTAFLRSELKRQLGNLERHIKRLDAHITSLIAADPALARRQAILTSLPGIGPVVAATLLADMPELGSLNRQAAACLAGLAPFADESGDRQGPRHIKGGRAHPRRALYWAALTATRRNPDLVRFYKRLIEDGKKPKVALIAVMRKLVVLANTLLKENRTWKPLHP